MNSIIAITGVVGAGKTTVAEKFATSAYIVRIDDVQFDAVRRAFPFVKKNDIFNWEVWPRDKTTMHLDKVLAISLRETHPDILEHRGSVIIEGCIVCQDWLMDPLLEDIKTICEFPEDTMPKRFELIPSPERVHQHIVSRNRPHELVAFADMETIKFQIHWAKKRTRKKGWTRFDTPEKLEQELKKLLGKG